MKSKHPELEALRKKANDENFRTVEGMLGYEEAFSDVTTILDKHYARLTEDDKLVLDDIFISCKKVEEAMLTVGKSHNHVQVWSALDELNVLLSEEVVSSDNVGTSRRPSKLGTKTKSKEEMFCMQCGEVDETWTAYCVRCGRVAHQVRESDEK